MEELRRRIADDRLAVAESSSIERKTGKLALTRTTLIQVLEADWITEAHEVRAHIAREQHASRSPQQRNVSRAMPRGMNNFDAAGDGQYFPVSQGLIDGNGLRPLVGIEEQPAQHLPQQTRCRPHRPKRTSTLGYGDVEWVHVGSCAGFPNDRSGAADMIMVAVSENQVPELVCRTANPRDRPENGSLLSREPGVD
jgi:hypothetical protein